MQNRFECHSHTHFSNIRLLDSINKPDTLMERAAEIGLKGIALTDHECLCGAVKWFNKGKEIIKKYPDFKYAIGNEIYLTDTRESGIRYWHFILIAKDAIGFKQLRELSSIAWMNSYTDRRLERVPTLKSDLKRIVGREPGHLIATTACIGGELSGRTLAMLKARKQGDKATEVDNYNKIVAFVKFLDEVFNDDWYIECAPGASYDQVIVNKKLIEIASIFNKKMVIGTDSHYLNKNDIDIHEAFLNSKGGERETKEFYQYAYLQPEEDIIKNLTPSIVDAYEQMCKNSMEIFDKITIYDISHPQMIPKVPVKNYEPKVNELSEYKVLSELFNSEDKSERYWVNECVNALKNKNKFNEEYLSELELEASIKRTVGKNLGTNMFNYPITLQHYIDLIWDCGSPIGPGRGSAPTALNHYLLSITQYDPIVYKQKFRRYMNEGQTELGDVDIDLSPTKKPLILSKICEERSKYIDDKYDSDTKNKLGAVMVGTFGTATSKRAIQIGCKGYRSEEYPNGIDVDVSAYLSSLIPQERGFVWSIKDSYFGNKEKGREPISLFVKQIDAYEGLLKIILGVEGLIVSRSSHASGVIFSDEDPYLFGCYMKTPSGDIVTQYDLHDLESVGGTKYDFLVTKAMDKITECVELLQKDNLLPKGNIREIYEKYLHPDVLDFEDKEIWKAIQDGKILDLFQFDSTEGSKGIKSIQPSNLTELSNVNGLIRLVAPDNSDERPIEKYQRFKANPQLWYDEMRKYNLTDENIKTLEKYYKSSYGISISQENFLFSLGDPGVCGWDFTRCNAARRVISKKKMDKLPILKEEIINEAATPELGRYYWDNVVLPISSYAFSDPHALAYAMVAYQFAYLATKFNSIYWNTACLIVDSGSLEVETIDNKKEKGTDYTKLATALGHVINEGIKISLVDINNSDYSFTPDAIHNQVLFGLKPLSNINEEIIEQIKNNRPYHSLKDFMNRVPIKKLAMISLIKGGAFDELERERASKIGLEPRIAAMIYYISKICEPKKKLNLQNFNGLIERGLVPKDLDFEVSIFKANKYFKKNKYKDYYMASENDYLYLSSLDESFADNISIKQDKYLIPQSVWDNYYKNIMCKTKDWIKDNQQSLLKQFNEKLFMELWEKYATGNISSWEMDSLCFYYHDHELKNVDKERYGIIDFNTLDPDGNIDKYWKKGDTQIPIFLISRLCGTVIAKNDSHSSISLLTDNGVVNVQFTRDLYAMYKKQISVIGDDGVKHVAEKGWFGRGNKLLVTGYRRDDTFRVKKYKSTGGHHLYKIDSVAEDGTLTLEHERVSA